MAPVLGNLPVLWEPQAAFLGCWFSSSIWPNLRFWGEAFLE